MRVRIAGEYYAAAVEVYQGSRLLTRTWLKGVFLATIALAGWLEHPSSGDLVVRRISDRGEVVRTDAGTSEEAALLLEHVTRQLATLTAEQFEEAWGIDAPTETGKAS